MTRYEERLIDCLCLLALFLFPPFLATLPKFPPLFQLEEGKPREKEEVIACLELSLPLFHATSAERGRPLATETDMYTGTLTFFLFLPSPFMHGMARGSGSGSVKVWIGTMAGPDDSQVVLNFFSMGLQAGWVGLFGGFKYSGVKSHGMENELKWDSERREDIFTEKERIFCNNY